MQERNRIARAISNRNKQLYEGIKPIADTQKSARYNSYTLPSYDRIFCNVKNFDLFQANPELERAIKKCLPYPFRIMDSRVDKDGLKFELQVMYPDGDYQILYVDLEKDGIVQTNSKRYAADDLSAISLIERLYGFTHHHE